VAVKAPRRPATQPQALAGSQSSYLLAVCYAEVGDSKRARDILAQIDNTARTRYVNGTYIAAIYAALDDKDRTVYDRSGAVNDVWMFPWFKPLHGDPR